MVKHILQCLTIAMLAAPAQASLNGKRQHIEVTPGESSQQLAQRYPHITKKNQQLGVNFYTINAPSDKRFPLTIKHGRQSIHIPYAMTFMGMDDTRRNVGMDEINVMFSLNATGSSMMPNDAKRALFAMFRQLMADGWQVLIYPSDPRLRGRDALINDLPEKSKPFNLDASYEPTLAEWIKIKKMTEWCFYANNVYVCFSFYFYYTKDKINQNQPIEYVFNMEVITGETYHRNKFNSEQVEQWREHWVERALEMRERRESAEAHARRIGLSIDTHYQDPPLPPPPPGMSNPTLPPELTQLRHVPLGTCAYSGAVCPQTGLWQCLAPEAEAQTRMLQEGATMPKYTAALPQQHPLWQWLTGTTPLEKYVKWKLISYG